PAGSDFGTNDWRSVLATNLQLAAASRSLSAYPAIDPATGTIPAASYPAFVTAVSDRQQLAKDIFNRLCSATGAINPLQAPGYTAVNPAMPAPGDPLGPYNASRWLAHLAANMVDSLDSDDYITPFNWNPNPALATDEGSTWVYGTEMPRLVLNEFYIEFVNDPADPGLLLNPKKATAPFNVKVNIWAE